MGNKKGIVYNAAHKYEYWVTQPMLPSNAPSPIMDSQQMTDWLNLMDEHGWEFVGYGQKWWHDKDIPQEWWIFRKPRLKV